MPDPGRYALRAERRGIKNIVMSEERKKRQQERDQPERPKSKARTAVIALLILAAFAAAYFLGMRKKTSRLDNFAKCLSAREVKMYGLFWCPHCEEQKELFGSSFQYVTYVECGIKGSHAEEQVCKDAGVKNFPTWQFAVERKEGVLSLPELAEKAGCSLP